jgi:hypothetical protein
MDFAERGEQVKLMGSVYLNSSRLLIWLGTKTLESEYETEFLKILRLMHGKASDLADQRDWIAEYLLHFLNRPWFTRSWILQEVILGFRLEALFHYGDAVFLPVDALNFLNDFNKMLWEISSMDPRKSDLAQQYLTALIRAELLFNTAIRTRYLSLSSTDALQREENTQLKEDKTTDPKVQPLKKSISYIEDVSKKARGMPKISEAGRVKQMPLQAYIVPSQGVDQVINQDETMTTAPEELHRRESLVIESGAHSIIPLKLYDSIEYWLSFNRVTNATNPRDKIYSVLGIITHITGIKQSKAVNLDALILDYEADVQDVFSSTVKAIVIATGKLDILGHCSKNSPLVRRTWTPDWTVREQRNYIAKVFGLPTSFSASAGRVCKASFSADLEVMTVRGMIWDTVYVQDSPKSNRRGLISARYPRTITAIGRALAEKSAYGSPEASKLASLRTLMTSPRCLSAVGLEISAEEFFSSTEMQALYETLSHDVEDWPANPRAAFWRDETMLSMWERQPYYNVTLVVTNNGWIGKTAYADRVKEGDLVCVLLGCPVPMILRPVHNYYEVIGDIYIDGIMFGEAIEALEEGKVELRDFELH